MDIRVFAHVTNTTASANNAQVQFDFWQIDRSTYDPVQWVKERLWRAFMCIGRRLSTIKPSHFSINKFLQQINQTGKSYFHYCCRINNNKCHQHRQRKEPRKRAHEIDCEIIKRKKENLHHEKQTKKSKVSNVYSHNSK